MLGYRAIKTDRRSPVYVVGAGFFGATVAQRLAEQGTPVELIEKRPHVAGNAYTYDDPATGINIHKYGTHIFHTSNEKIWNYVNRFSEFNSYQHKVLANYKGQLFNIPVNLDTAKDFYQQDFTPESFAEFMAEKTKPYQSGRKPKNLEEKGLQTLGKELFEAFFQGYTQKQWEMDPKLLPAKTIARIPVRYDSNDRYFSDTYEGIPIHGYTPLIEKMLESDLINIHLNTDFFDIHKDIPPTAKLIYSGPIDRYFNYSEGVLNWRTLDFEFETHERTENFQPVSVVNYPELSYPYTRIHEFKYLYPEKASNQRGSVTAKEYSRAAGIGDEPYYPVNAAEDREKMKRYRKLASDVSDRVTFGGRLGSYKYLDMHMAIESSGRSLQLIKTNLNSLSSTLF